MDRLKIRFMIQVLHLLTDICRSLKCISTNESNHVMELHNDLLKAERELDNPVKVCEVFDASGKKVGEVRL